LAGTISWDRVDALGGENQRLFIALKDKIVVAIFARERNKFEGHRVRLLDRIFAAYP
jgi:hypothetical protein